MDAETQASFLDLTEAGEQFVRRGDFRRAIDNFERAIALAEEMADQALLVKALCNLSTARLAAGDIKEAERGLRQILLRTREPQIVFRTSFNIASALRRQGRLDRALMYAKRALNACEAIDNPAWKASCHNLIGNIYMNKSYLDDAVAEFRVALALGKRGERKASWPIDTITENLGYCLLLKKKYRRGITIIHQALAIAEKNDNVRCVSESHQDLSFAYMQTKELVLAGDHGEQALTLAIQQDYKDIQKNCYYLLGEIHLLKGDEAKSDHYFDRLQEFFPHLPVIKDFLRNFDVSSIINLKNPV
ncbi:MAG TPA: tetratricopeptide repeat protein [Patescibacteria group bacterium]|nr:tetratricopeptide repeat protein [Patescibacteria group bacterium]